jgi:hypothetical protein
MCFRLLKLCSKLRRRNGLLLEPKEVLQEAFDGLAGCYQG